MRWLIYILILSFSNLTAQDSLKLYSVPKWKLNRLLDAYAYDLPSCDSTLNQHIKALDLSKKTLSVSDSLLKEVTISRDSWKFTSLSKDTIITNRDLIHDNEIRYIKRKKLYMTLTAIGEGVLIVLLIL